MKPEPLKNEIYTLEQLRLMTEIDGNKELVFVYKLKEAVEWLEKRSFLSEGIRIVDWCWVKEAFEDVTKIDKKNN